MSNSETNKIFNYNAQTPTTYFIGKTVNVTENQIVANTLNIKIFDKSLKKYIDYPIFPERNIPIPLTSISIIKKLQPFLLKVGAISVIKTNMPPQKSKFSISSSEEYPYKSVKTCVFALDTYNKNIKTPQMIYQFSNIPQAYFNNIKLIFAHKMYGLPYIDKTGEIGISNRDNYVIINKSLEELEILKKFFETKLALSIFNSTRYRMSYLEKYAFQLIPDITRLEDFPKIINDETLANYFNLSQEEREIIEKNQNFNYF
jgi:hypothetical protein